MAHVLKAASVREIRLKEDPALEAWVYHFLTENNLEYLVNPSIVASPEQLRFMVALTDDQIYAPCDDALFRRMYTGEDNRSLAREYVKAWRFIVGLIGSYRMSEKDSLRILSICRYRFHRYFRERVVLPSRMIKRLLTLVLTQCGDNDPFRARKLAANGKVAELMRSEGFKKAFYKCPAPAAGCETIPDLRWELDIAEISRFLSLSTRVDIWQEDGIPKDLAARTAEESEQCGVLRNHFGPESAERKKVLYITDVAGGFMFDLALIKSLLRQGHQVVLSLKDAFYFNSIAVWDLEHDPEVRALLGEAYVCSRENLSKNELLNLLREHRLVIISDGTAEQLNLYRVSVTFARAWKECDLVIAKGRRNRGVLMGTSHLFTRDILCCCRDDDGIFHIEEKKRAPWVRKFAEKDITAMAKGIITAMRAAKEAGKTIMFYSAIIGSIPGQTKTAVKLVNTFAEHLRARLENTFIINPAEHFEEGLDGDDLMFMWEQVQRSGLLDVWRFQSVEDIEVGFSLMGSKVPAVWSGKDSTFSTGCTKEMRIALDMQRDHPELQIISPAPERFFRRRDYGVGRYFDAALKA